MTQYSLFSPSPESSPESMHQLVDRVATRVFARLGVPQAPDRADLPARSFAGAGTCRHCGCTEANACRLQTGDACCWTNKARTVCSNGICVWAERKAKVRFEEDKKATLRGIQRR